jgi:hypothetical protein
MDSAQRLDGRLRYGLVRELEFENIFCDVDLLNDERPERLRQLLGVVLLDERA